MEKLLEGECSDLEKRGWKWGSVKIRGFVLNYLQQQRRFVFCAKKVVPPLTLERGRGRGHKSRGNLASGDEAQTSEDLGCAGDDAVSKSSSSVPVLLVILHRYLNDFVNRRCSRWCCRKRHCRLKFVGMLR